MQTRKRLKLDHILAVDVSEIRWNYKLLASRQWPSAEVYTQEEELQMTLEETRDHIQKCRDFFARPDLQDDVLFLNNLRLAHLTTTTQLVHIVSRFLMTQFSKNSTTCPPLENRIKKLYVVRILRLTWALQCVRLRFACGRLGGFHYPSRSPIGHPLFSLCTLALKYTLGDDRPVGEHLYSSPRTMAMWDELLDTEKRIATVVRVLNDDRSYGRSLYKGVLPVLWRQKQMLCNLLRLYEFGVYYPNCVQPLDCYLRTVAHWITVYRPEKSQLCILLWLMIRHPNWERDELGIE